MQDQNAVTPQRIFQTINAFQSSAALKELCPNGAKKTTIGWTGPRGSN